MLVVEGFGAVGADVVLAEVGALEGLSVAFD